MSAHKISTLLALSLISSPIASSVSIPSYNNQTKAVPSENTSSQRAAARRMRHQLYHSQPQTLNLEHAKVPTPVLQDYIRPPLATLIEAPLPEVTASDQVVGIYGNILYPQDKEQIQQQKLTNWIEAYSKDSNVPFPLSPEDFNDISV